LVGLAFTKVDVLAGAAARELAVGFNMRKSESVMS
jgi:hypothetical protein